MANITPRKNRDGEIISYQIRVFRGRNADGTRLKDYMMTWRPSGHDKAADCQRVRAAGHIV